jgi:hypothetical protein
MNIAVIGSGNVGSVLAVTWAHAGHDLTIGVRDLSKFKGASIVRDESRIRVALIPEAVHSSDVILLAVPGDALGDVAATLGNVQKKILIDASNSLRQRPGSPSPHEVLRSQTPGADVVKCFNTTGFNIMANPVFAEGKADMFIAGDSQHAKAVVRRLALDAGFGECYDVGGADKVPLLESFALLWITLAMQQGYGREIAFKLMRR